MYSQNHNIIGKLFVDHCDAILKGHKTNLPDGQRTNNIFVRASQPEKKLW